MPVGRATPASPVVPAAPIPARAPEPAPPAPARNPFTPGPAPLPPSSPRYSFRALAFCLGVDLVLLGTAGWLAFTLPLRPLWSYTLAAACVGLGALVACLIPTLARSAPAPGTSGKPGSGNPRIRVQLTRL